MAPPKFSISTTTISVIVTIFAVLNCSCNAQKSPIRITSIIEEPYLMLAKSEQALTGNERYEGFAKDLAEILSGELNFTYSLNLVRDGMYGTVSSEGIWNGMIGELTKGAADIAIAPLTMSRNRAEAVDFSTPFMEFQLRIAMKAPEVGESIEEIRDPGSYIFLRPFSPFLWVVIVITIIVLLLLLFTIELYVPVKQDVAKQPRNPRPVIGFCANGVLGSPRTVSGRVLQIVFWIFIIIVVAAYIATFTGDRIVDRLGDEDPPGTSPIKSIEDLGAQTQIKYGLIRGGSTYEYFRRSWQRLHRKMFAAMIRDSGLTKSSQEGYQRVQEGPAYVFIAEGPNAEYMSAKSCSIFLAPIPFGPRRAFAVATRNTPDPELKKLKDGMNLVILRMKETGKMEELRKKWFAGEGQCTAKRSGGTVEEIEMEEALTLYNMAGVFYLLITVVLVALLIAAAEILRKKGQTQPRRDGAVELRVPPSPTRNNVPPAPTGNST